MPTPRLSILPAITLLTSACMVDAPPSPSDGASHAPAPSLQTTARSGAENGTPADRHPALASPEHEPLAGCKTMEVAATVSWSCGPDRVALVQYPGPLPERADAPSTFAGGAPSIERFELQVGERTLTGEHIVNPRLEHGPRTFSIVVEDAEARRVGSCVSLLDVHDPEDQLVAWCKRAVATALQTDLKSD